MEWIHQFLLAQFLIGYFIGSIPFGLLLTKLFGHGDIRKIGSGNIGATNVLRTGNKKLAIATLILDALKGFVVVANVFIIYGINKHYFPETNPLSIEHVTIIVAFSAIIGHCYPIWLKFKGGKGMATALGALLAAVPIAGLVACSAWLITAKLTKISSLSALVAIAIVPIVTLFVYGSAPATICVLITLLVWLRHRENIKRLLAGTEPKIGAKKKEEQDNPQS